MEILLTITYTFLFIFVIGQFRFYQIPGISLKTMKGGFLLKVFFGILVGIVYSHYYTDRLTADTFKFFDDSEIMFNALYTNPADYFRMLTGIGAGAPGLQHYYDEMNNWYDVFSPFNDNRTMIRVNAFLRLVSFGNYYVHVVFIAFLSFSGIVAITRVFMKEYPHLSTDVFLVFLLMPSVLFWGSGLLKDALVFFSLGMTLLTFTWFINSKQRKILYAITFVSALFLLMITKFQVFLLILPLLAAWSLVLKYQFSTFFTFLGTGLVVFIIMVIAGNLHAPLNLAAILAGKQAAFFELIETTEAASAISIPILQPNYSSIVVNAPLGLWTALTRPFITDPGSILSRISAVENIFILVFAFWSILKIKKQKEGNHILLNFCLFYAFTYLTLIGMITPILGAMVRYKAQAIPFMMMLFVIISSNNREGIISKYFNKARNIKWKFFSH